MKEMMMMRWMNEGDDDDRWMKEMMMRLMDEGDDDDDDTVRQMDEGDDG